MTAFKHSTLLLCMLFLLGLSGLKAEQAYGPLEAKNPVLDPLDLEVTDTKREREIPLRIYLPDTDQPCPVVLFSHGLGGDREGSAYLGQHWAARGYVAVFMQHPGSDSEIWKDLPRGERTQALANAATAENWQARIQDVNSVLRRLESWNSMARFDLFNRLDLNRVGMSGHSFGALTTQWVSGQQGQGLSWTHSAVKAAVALSPSPPRQGSVEEAFAKVSLPWLLITGTDDDSPLGDTEPEDRLKVFPALPPGHKYELVLDGARHSAFSDHELLPGHAARNPNHHRAVMAITTAFWDAHLQGDSAAKSWLTGDGVKGALEADDRWQSK